jgi:hypothetical protein
MTLTRQLPCRWHSIYPPKGTENGPQDHRTSDN